MVILIEEDPVQVANIVHVVPSPAQSAGKISRLGTPHHLARLAVPTVVVSRDLKYFSWEYRNIFLTINSDLLWEEESPGVSSSPPVVDVLVVTVPDLVPQLLHDVVSSPGLLQQRQHVLGLTCPQESVTSGLFSCE